MTHFIYIVDVEAASQQESDQVMAERLGHDEDYGFPYTLEWAHGRSSSFVYPDPETGQEYDVRVSPHGEFNVNDDAGRNYRDSSLWRAIRKARFAILGRTA